MSSNQVSSLGLHLGIHTIGQALALSTQGLCARQWAEAGSLRCPHSHDLSPAGVLLAVFDHDYKGP